MSGLGGAPGGAPTGAHRRRRRRRALVASPGSGPGKGDSLGVLRAFAEDVAAAFGRRGWDCDLAAGDEPDFWDRARSVGAEPDGFVFFAQCFFNAPRDAAPDPTGWSHIFAAPPPPGGGVADALRAPSAAFFVDHPLASFVLDRTLGLTARPDCPIFVFEPAFADQIRVVRPDLDAGRFAVLPGLFLSPTPPGAGGREEARGGGAAADRPFDLLLPVHLRAGGSPGEIVAAGACQPGRLGEIAEAVAPALLATYEDCRDGHAICPWARFLELLAETAGLDFAALLRDEPDRAREVSRLHTAVDVAIRDARRARLARALLSRAEGLTVCLVGNGEGAVLPRGGPPPGVEIHRWGLVGARDLVRLMSLSRAVMHSQPTYPRCLHERFLNAASQGCAVVCEPAPAFAERLPEGEAWIAARPGLGAADLFDLHGGREGLAAVGATARAWARENVSADRHVERIEAALDAGPVAAGLSPWA